MSASRTPAHTFAQIVYRRLVLPVWNSLVAYGSLWLPADQYRLPYLHGRTAVPSPLTEPAPTGAGDGFQPDRETLRVS
ncbi:hypothetical protein SAVIM338S_07359 [Streptomyces avidinii]